MTLKELMDRVLALCPDAVFDEDSSGEVIVYTGAFVHPEDDWLHGSLPVQDIDGKHIRLYTTEGGGVCHTKAQP